MNGHRLPTAGTLVDTAVPNSPELASRAAIENVASLIVTPRAYPRNVARSLFRGRAHQLISNQTAINDTPTAARGPEDRPRRRKSGLAIKIFYDGAPIGRIDNHAIKVDWLLHINHEVACPIVIFVRAFQCASPLIW